MGRGCMTSGGLEQSGVASRPSSIIWFERLAWAALLVTAAMMVANWTTLAKYYNKYPTAYPIMLVVSFPIQLFWIWLIARRRKNWARWISLVVMVIGIPNAILDYDKLYWSNLAAEIAWYLAYAIWLVAISMLFRRDARDWFSRRRFASSG
jgi:hypothetical protein